MICQAKFVLGISGTCSKEEVFRAFRRLALIFHPDKNGNSEESKRKFQVIQQSKVTLLTHLGEALGHVEREEGPAQKSPKSPKTDTRTCAAASWVCSACENFERATSPSSSGRSCASTCVQIEATSPCFCGHGFAQHRLSDDKFACTTCSCEAFLLRQPTTTCVCGCHPEDHIEVFPFPCRRCTGSCQQFYSTHNCGKCGCGWACHRVRTCWKDDLHGDKQAKKSSEPHSNGSTEASSTEPPETHHANPKAKDARRTRPTTNMFELFAQEALKTNRSVNHPFRVSSGISNPRSFLKARAAQTWASTQSPPHTEHAAKHDTSAPHAGTSNPKSAPRVGCKPPQPCTEPYTERPRPHSATSARVGSKHSAPKTEPRSCRRTPQRPQSAGGRLGARKVQPSQRPQSATPGTFGSIKQPIHRMHESRSSRPQSASGRIGAGKVQPTQGPQSAAHTWLGSVRQSMQRPQSAAGRLGTEEPTTHHSGHRQEYRPRHDKQQQQHRVGDDTSASRPRPQSAHVRGSAASKTAAMDPRTVSDDMPYHATHRVTPTARNTAPAPSCPRPQSAKYVRPHTLYPPPSSEALQDYAIPRASTTYHFSADVSSLHQPKRARPRNATAAFFSQRKSGVGGEEEGDAHCKDASHCKTWKEDDCGAVSHGSGEEERHEYRPTTSSKPPMRPTHGGMRRENLAAGGEPTAAVSSEAPYVGTTPICPTDAPPRTRSAARHASRPATSGGSHEAHHCRSAGRAERRALSATECRARKPCAGAPRATAARAQQRRAFVEHVQRERALASHFPSNDVPCGRNAGMKVKTQHSRGGCPRGQRGNGQWCRGGAVNGGGAADVQSREKHGEARVVDSDDEWNFARSPYANSKNGTADVPRVNYAPVVHDPSRPPLHVLRSWNNPWSWNSPWLNTHSIVPQS
eukprot:GEMP01005333.1.p1 GENE.GEMP01005333.1~~GEMP01005333.1.p1  ORF type:complete len:916 (+),score=260.52 GEMP01005333.1:282-3029(+)